MYLTWHDMDTDVISMVGTLSAQFILIKYLACKKITSVIMSKNPNLSQINTLVFRNIVERREDGCALLTPNATDSDNHAQATSSIT